MIWMNIASLVSYFVKGICGFANTLIFTTILSFPFENINISPLELLLGYPANAIMAWRERKHIDWRLCMPVSAIVILGTIPGTFMLKNMNAGIIKVLFGFVITALGINMLLRQRSSANAAKPSRIVLTGIGLLSGLLSGLYGIGALMAVYMGYITDDSHSFKANMCFVFVITNGFRVVLYAALKLITLETCKNALFLAPSMLIGLFLGLRCSKLMDEKLVKRVIILMLIASGIALVLKNITAIF